MLLLINKDYPQSILFQEIVTVGLLTASQNNVTESPSSNGFKGVKIVFTNGGKSTFNTVSDIKEKCNAL